MFENLAEEPKCLMPIKCKTNFGSVLYFNKKETFEKYVLFTAEFTQMCFDLNDDEPGGEYGGQPGQDWRAGKEQTCGHLDSLTLFDSWLKDHLHVHEKDAENGEGCGVDDVDKTLSGQHPVKKSCCI